MKDQTTRDEDRDFSQYMENNSGIYQYPTYDLRVAIDFIRSRYSPEDIFDDDQLKTWAIENGFVEDLG